VNRPDTNSETYIVFEVAGTSYGISTKSVQQVEMVEHITPLPNASAFVEGVVFTRGQVIPAINIRLRFGFEKTPHTTRTRLIVTNHGGRTVGLIVDSAREFMSLSNESIQPAPDTVAGLSGKYLHGIVTIGDRIVLILDLAELISNGNGQTRALALEA
jgi:purine-binding chemotaxis protein CheW